MNLSFKHDASHYIQSTNPFSGIVLPFENVMGEELTHKSTYVPAADFIILRLGVSENGAYPLKMGQCVVGKMTIIRWNFGGFPLNCQRNQDII